MDGYDPTTISSHLKYKLKIRRINFENEFQKRTEFIYPESRLRIQCRYIFNVI